MKDANLYNQEYYKRLKYGLKSETRSDHKRILELLKVEPTDKILEIGCGFGVLIKQIPSLQKIGIEISEIAISECRDQGLSVIKADVEKGIPFDDSIFDIVIMNEVIEHLKNPERALRECFRVLKAHGKIVITMPVYHLLTSRGEARRTHFSEMTIKELRDLMKSTGFRILNHEASGIFFFYPLLDFFLFRPFRLLRNRGIGIKTIDKGHAFADETFLRPLSLFRRKFLWIGLTQLVLAQKKAED